MTFCNSVSPFLISWSLNILLQGNGGARKTVSGMMCEGLDEFAFFQFHIFVQQFYSKTNNYIWFVSSNWFPWFVVICEALLANLFAYWGSNAFIFKRVYSFSQLRILFQQQEQIQDFIFSFSSTIFFFKT